MSDFSQPLVSAPTMGVISTASRFHAMLYQTVIAGVFNSTSTWTTANKAVYQAVLVPSTVTVTHLAVIVATQNGNIDVGIYNECGNRLVSSGSTAVGAAGLQSFDVTDTTLTPGVYWLACVCSSTSASLRANGTAVAANNGATARARGIMVEASALPLPTTATFASQGAAAFNLPAVSAFFRTTF